MNDEKIIRPGGEPATPEEEPWPQAPNVGPNRIDIRPHVRNTHAALMALQAGPRINPLSVAAGKIIAEWREGMLKRVEVILDGWLELHKRRCLRCLMPVDFTGRCYSCAFVTALARIAEEPEPTPARELARETLATVFALADRDIDPGFRRRRDGALVEARKHGRYTPTPEDIEAAEAAIRRDDAIAAAGAEALADGGEEISSIAP